DSNHQEYFFNGSIGNVDFAKATIDYQYINGRIFWPCVTSFRGEWEHKKWTGLRRLARPVNCATRVPMMGIYAYNFRSNANFQWLEQEISPARNLTAFTMLFQIKRGGLFPNPSQIACYGDRGDDCRISVVINVNSTLEIIIESRR
ncbi:Hypothetical predicted protein, partial [Paramuricea clavata]